MEKHKKLQRAAEARRKLRGYPLWTSIVVFTDPVTGVLMKRRVKGTYIKAKHGILRRE